MTLQAGYDFIESALKGRVAASAVQFSDKAIEASDAYGDAIDATLQLQHEGVDIADIHALFSRIASTLHALTTCKELDARELELVRKFFDVLHEVTLADAAGSMERVSIGTK